MRAFVVLAVLAAAVLASTELNVDFVSGENLTDAEANFKFRFQKTAMIPNLLVPVFPSDVFVWSSVSVDADAADSKALASADALAGVAIPPNRGFFPVGIVGFGTGKASAQVKFDSLESLQKLIFGGSFKGDFNAGVVAMAAFYIGEYTADGNYVEGTAVRLSDESCDPESVRGDDIHGMTCTMSPKNTPAKITVTYVTSEKAGILKYGQTPVSPRSMEMIIKVDGFKLTKKENHIRMVLGLITASGSGEVEGNAKVIKSEDHDDVYVAASEYAIVDDERVQVDVNVTGGFDDLGAVEAVLNAVLGGSVDIKKVDVDFPAGEESFIYDPAAGSGSNVYLAGASTAALSLLAALVCALLYFF
jgi:hypothetical protein